MILQLTIVVDDQDEPRVKVTIWKSKIQKERSIGNKLVFDLKAIKRKIKMLTTGIVKRMEILAA